MSENNYYKKRMNKNSRNIKKSTSSAKKSKIKKRYKQKNKYEKRRKFFLLISTLILIFTFALAGAGFGFYARIKEQAPTLDILAIQPNIYTSIVYDKNDKEIDRFYGHENREYAKLDEIPKNLQNAIISVEDERFYKHFGIDIKGILRAFVVTVKNKLTGSSGLEGASTITQQLIKNNVTKVTRNTIKTKLQEQYLAISYEAQLKKMLGSKKQGKDYILELYLNTIALGHGYNGVQAAALGYFNKNVSELTLAESASIASITNNPTLYSPRSNPEKNKSRQQRILKKMLEQNMISEQEYKDALEEDIYSKISDNYTKLIEEGNIHSYFIDSLFEQISNDLQEKYNISVAQANNLLYNGGLEITSTMDLDIQKIVDETYLDDKLFPNVTYGLDVTYVVSIENKQTGKQNHSEYKKFVKTKEDADNFVASKKAEIESNLKQNEHILVDKTTITVQPQSSMVIMDYKTGEVRALIGGRGEKTVNRSFNRAVNSERQPGSVFKPLAAFAPGIDLGILTPATVIDDVPFSQGDYSPSNWYSNPSYRGLSTIREGIRDSMNIVAVKSMLKTGIEQSYNYLLNFGFTTLKDDKHLATALGGLTNGVTQLEVTAAYGAIANGGKYNKPILYTKVLDHNGNVLLENNASNNQKQVLKETSAFLLTSMLQDVVTSGTGTKAKFLKSKMPIAGKTGTTQESRDLTFVGYTPYYVAGIWLGYDRYDSTVKNMSNLSQSQHLVIWRTIMEKIHQNLEVKSFTKPSNITTAQICTESGLLATDICKEDPRGNVVKTEFFDVNNVPTESCNVHKKVEVCTETNMLAGDFCPDNTKKTIVGIVRPEPYNGSEFVADRIYEIPKAICNVHNEESVFITPESNNYENFDTIEEPSTNFEDDILGELLPPTLEQPTISEQTSQKVIIKELVVPNNSPTINLPNS